MSIKCYNNRCKITYRKNIHELSFYYKKRDYSVTNAYNLALMSALAYDESDQIKNIFSRNQ